MANVKVRVPQADGEITITPNAGDEPRRYRITDHEATVATDDLETFLVHVDGSTETAKPAASATKEK